MTGTSASTAAPRGQLPSDFWRLWSAGVVSRLGSGLVGAAMPLLAAQLTRDPRQVALVSVFSGLPWVLLALHSGALADRWDRRRTMWLCDVAAAVVQLVLAVVVIAGGARIWTLCLTAFVATSLLTLFDSASQAALPSVVPAPLLGRANSRVYAGTVLAGMFVGPPLGSWLFSVADGLPFLLNAASFLGSAALLATIGTRIAGRAAGASRTRLTADIGEGLRWLWSHRQLRWLVVLLACWNLIENAYLGILVLYALEVLDVGASAYGVLLTGVGAGGLLGAAAAPWLSRRLGDGVVIAGTVALTVVGTAGLALTRHLAAAVGFLAVIGAAAFAFNVVTVTYRQSVVPGALQGRVSSAYRFATWGITPLGAALGGLAAHTVGVVGVLAGAAVALAVVGLAVLPQLSNARLRQHAAPAATPPDRDTIQTSR
ncbi:MFS transporter [Goekera deserti]|uniref:MFS transporter n=1 Tax=Goekera deserti TaxID=2497753 RepID=A0A7K3WJ30_9ACTN|nr:MFS transporter [Goekera deserti]NDI46610.1 MFS transporter [Goekera deserti]NEL56366.1 MFS transporter [Goekera deserti]